MMILLKFDYFLCASRTLSNDCNQEKNAVKNINDSLLSSKIQDVLFLFMLHWIRLLDWNIIVELFFSYEKSFIIIFNYSKTHFLISLILITF